MLIELIPQFPLSEALDPACQQGYTHYHAPAADHRLGTRMILERVSRTQLLLKELELECKVVHEGLRDRDADDH